jgi:hypothetical protein
MAVIDATWSVATVSTVWHERYSRVQAAACQGHSRPWRSVGIKGCGMPVNTRKEPPPPGHRGAYWPREGAVQLAQYLGPPVSARSVRPRYSLAAL